MKLISQNPKAGEMKFLVTEPDDLWHLYHIIEPGDVVKGVTFRREEGRMDAIRAEREEKRRIFISLSVERCEFHEFSSTLRVMGIILEAPFDRGAHHTLNVGIGSELSLVKQRWPAQIMERIKEAISGTGSSRIIAVAIEYGEATIAVIKSFGVDEIATVYSSMQKESTGKEDREAFYREIVEQVKALPTLPVIVVGPGFIKEDFIETARVMDPARFGSAKLVSSGQGGMSGIREALSSPENVSVLRDVRIARESALLEELKRCIAVNGLCTYGFREVSGALEAGAVAHLLVTDRMLRQDEGRMLMERAEGISARHSVLTSDWETGRELDALGGVAAFLRFRL